MATRTTPAPKGTARGTNTAKSGSSAGRGAGSTRSQRTGRIFQPAAARTRQLPAVEQHQPWLLRVVGGAWLGVGHLVGGGVRRIGSDVSDLPAEERRDGAALFNLALGVFIATFAWWGLTGWFPDAVYSVVNGTFGWVSLLLPLMLFVCAFRLFRRPDDGRGNNRVGIGFLIMTFAGCGLAHVLGGQPTVAEGFDGLRQAGGMLGFLAASPLAAIHAVVPVVLYGLLAFISLLIITATPFGAIPRRLHAAYEHLMGVDLQEPGEAGDSHDRSYLEETRAAAAPKKKKRRFFGKDEESDAGLEGYVGDEAFEHAVIDDDDDDGGRKARHAAPRPAPGVRRPTQAEIAVEKIKAAQGLGTAGHSPADNATEAIPLVTPGMVAAGSLNPCCRSAGSGQARHSGAAAHAHSAADRAALPGGRRHLHPAVVGRSDPRFHPQGTHRSQRRRRRRPHRHPPAVQCGRHGHRLQPWTHRHPLRDRTGIGDQGGAGHCPVQEYFLRGGFQRRPYPQPHSRANPPSASKSPTPTVKRFPWATSSAARTRAGPSTRW